MTGIYKIESRVKPERIYVGSAVNLKKRWLEHIRLLKKDKHHSKKLQNHVNKYGIDDLCFIIIEFCFPQFLIIREQYYIDDLKPWFNICLIAGSVLGCRWKLSEESIRNMVNGHRGLVVSEESRRKMSIAQKGRPGRKGIPLTEQHKQRISELQQGEKNSMYKKEPWNKGKKGLQVAWNKGKNNNNLKVA